MCREVRTLRRYLLICAVAIVGLGGALAWSQRSHAIAIGNVTIDDDGIEIVDGANSAKLDAKSFRLYEQEKGGVGMWPAELVINDAARTRAVRMQAWSEGRGGIASVSVESRKPSETRDHWSSGTLISEGPYAGVHVGGMDGLLVEDKRLTAGK